MSIFCILKNQKKNRNNSEFEIIKVGFSWKAFFFSFIWGFSNKLWIFSFSFLIFFLLIFYAKMLFFINISHLSIFLLLNNLYWGFYGNSILINSLILNNFKPEKLIECSNYDNANLIFISGK